MLILGTMMTRINSLNLAAELLREEDFYYREHRHIFFILKEAYSKDLSIDFHLVIEELKRKEQLQEVGGEEYVVGLAQYAGTSLYVEEYIRLIKNKSLLRQLISIIQGVEREAFEDPHSAEELLDTAQQQLFELSQESRHSLGFSLKQLLSGEHLDSKKPFLELIQERQERYRSLGKEEVSITGVRTHFSQLDTLLDGLVPSNLIILAARPAMGKTALALNIASNIAFLGKKAVAFFSLEMSAEQLLHRMICAHAEVEAEKVRTGSITGEQFQQLVSSVHIMQKSTLIIEDQPSLRISDLRTRARRMKEVYGIECVVIDYLQLIVGGNSRRAAESRQLEISEISRLLKSLAKELHLPVLCLAQLSRKVEERTDHLPQMSDLRESGSIEQDADQVCFVFRPDYYDPNKAPGMVQVIVRKNRNGPVGTVQLTWMQTLQKFYNYHPPQEEENVWKEGDIRCK